MFKMARIEKVMIAAMILCLLGMVVSIRSCSYTVEQAGGFKQMIIEAGKDLKEIEEEINAS